MCVEPASRRFPNRGIGSWVKLIGSILVTLASSQGWAAEPPDASPGSDVGNHITVTGRNEKVSRWKRAESEHVVIFSQGSDDELRRIDRNIELLDRLMARLYLKGSIPPDPVKMQVTLLNAQSQLADMELQNLRTQEGPFAKAFSITRYFDLSESGDLLAMARVDQSIDLNTNRRFNDGCERYYSGGGTELCGAYPNPPPSASGAPHANSTNVVRLPPLTRSWEARLYSAYAQHFMLTNVPAAYPRWFLDGIGAFFSTIVSQPDGAVTYAQPPGGYKDIFQSYGYPDVSAILSGRYLTDAKAAASWSPYGAWLLTHYFTFSKLQPERQAQFEQYMGAIRQGTSMAHAALVFGDFRKLQRDIGAYAQSRMAFTRAEPPATPVGPPLITPLSQTSGRLVELRVEMASRFSNPSTVSPSAKAWVAELEQQMPSLGQDDDALLFLAEAQCRVGEAAKCQGIAEHVLAHSPDDVRALTWSGSAMVEQAMASSMADRAIRLVHARRALERAADLDEQAPLPQIAYFRSFIDAGEAAPEGAMRKLSLAIRDVPAAPGPRLSMSKELIRRGNTDLALRVLSPVAFGGYDSPEKLSAADVLPPAQTVTH